MITTSRSNCHPTGRLRHFLRISTSRQDRLTERRYKGQLAFSVLSHLDTSAGLLLVVRRVYISIATSPTPGSSDIDPWASQHPVHRQDDRRQTVASGASGQQGPHDSCGCDHWRRYKWSGTSRSLLAGPDQTSLIPPLFMSTQYGQKL